MPKIRGGTFEYNMVPEVSWVTLAVLSSNRFLQSRLGFDMTRIQDICRAATEWSGE